MEAQQNENHFDIEMKEGKIMENVLNPLGDYVFEDELAKKLEVSKWTIRTFRRYGLPASKVGRRLVYYIPDVVEWLNSFRTYQQKVFVAEPETKISKRRNMPMEKIY